LIGIAIWATFLSAETVTSTGPLKCPVATARFSSSLVAATTDGLVTSRPAMVTTAGICPPGNAASILS
jgi:hypothetical protein